MPPCVYWFAPHMPPFLKQKRTEGSQPVKEKPIYKNRHHISSQEKSQREEENSAAKNIATPGQCPSFGQAAVRLGVGVQGALLPFPGGVPLLVVEGGLIDQVLVEGDVVHVADQQGAEDNDVQGHLAQEAVLLVHKADASGGVHQESKQVSHHGCASVQLLRLRCPSCQCFPFSAGSVEGNTRHALQVRCRAVGHWHNA